LCPKKFHLPIFGSSTYDVSVPYDAQNEFSLSWAKVLTRMPQPGLPFCAHLPRMGASMKGAYLLFCGEKKARIVKPIAQMKVAFHQGGFYAQA
jgi:hypothetical protein